MFENVLVKESYVQLAAEGRILPSRRAVLSGSAAVLALQAIPRLARAQPTRVRQSITSPNLRAQTVASYKAAVRAMLALPMSDPRNWYRQAMVHLFDCPHGNWWFVSWHRGYLLHFEEICRELSGDPEFALPYWDWTREQRVPAVMFEDALDPRSPEFPLADFTQFRAAFAPVAQQIFANATPAQRQVLQLRNYSSADQLLTMIGEQELFAPRDGARGLASANPALTADAVRATGMDTIGEALRRSPFERFGSEGTQNHILAGRQDPLEAQPHNMVHGALAGDLGFMGALLSPVDPIFWLHHANVDRLWDVWTRRQRAGGLPHLPAGADGERWQNDAHPFFVDGKGQALNDRSTRNYIDNVALGYAYEPGSGEELVQQTASAGAAASRPGMIMQIRTSAVPQALELGRAASGTVRLNGGLAQALRSRPVSSDSINDVFRESGPPRAVRHEQLPALAASVALTLPHRTRHLRFDVFLNVPGVPPALSLDDPQYVGSIFAFGIEHMILEAAKGHRSPGATAEHNMMYSLPLGPALERLRSSGLQLGDTFDIRVLPRQAGRSRESSAAIGSLAGITLELG